MPGSRSAGMAEKKASKAPSPPADAPMPTMGKALDGGASDGSGSTFFACGGEAIGSGSGVGSLGVRFRRASCLWGIVLLHYANHAPKWRTHREMIQVLRSATRPSHGPELAS